MSVVYVNFGSVAVKDLYRWLEFSDLAEVLSQQPTQTNDETGSVCSEIRINPKVDVHVYHAFKSRSFNPQYEIPAAGQLTFFLSPFFLKIVIN